MNKLCLLVTFTVLLLIAVAINILLRVVVHLPLNRPIPLHKDWNDVNKGKISLPLSPVSGKTLNLTNKSILPTKGNDGAEQQINGNIDDRVHQTTNISLPNWNAIKNNVTKINSPVHLVFLKPTWQPLPSQGESRVDNCDVPCFYSGYNNKEEIGRSSAVIFLLYSLNHIPWNTQQSSDPDVILKSIGVDPSSVFKVGMTMESTVNCRDQLNLISKYDIEFSYRETSDVWKPNFEFLRFDLLKPVPNWHQRHSAVVFVASNCNSFKGKREQFVKKLQNYVQVNSVAGCLHNTKWPNDIPRSDKIGLLERYKVYLAAENSIENDYITEKVYDGLVSGAVPIYLGAPNVKEFIPSNSAIIVPPNYTENDIASVAQAVKKIFDDESEYERWTSFKHHDYEDWFKKRFSFTRVSYLCRLCRKVFAQREGYSWDRDSQQIV